MAIEKCDAAGPFVPDHTGTVSQEGPPGNYAVLNPGPAEGW